VKSVACDMTTESMDNLAEAPTTDADMAADVDRQGAEVSGSHDQVVDDMPFMEEDATPASDDASGGDVTAGDSAEVTVESVVEAVLFASDEPLTAERIVGVLETGSAKQVRQAVERLNAEYEQQGRPFRIEQIAGGYQMMTLPAYNPWIRKLLRVRTDTKLSPAALETLAIVAYKQPIIRADIEAIRGVACGEVLRNLMYKGLVKMVGRAEVLGRPMLYGTTKKFLDVFGLASLKDLPKIEDLKLPGNGGSAE